jgi:type II secretory pathway component PulC
VPTGFTAPRAAFVESAVPEPALPVAVAGPALTLSGIARTGATRTAIISSGGQVYVVSEGDSVAGLFTVITVDPEAVLLRDAAGGELRLGLPQ